VPHIRRMASLDAPQILDLMDRGAYYAFEGAEITAAAISEFIKAYEEKSLARQQLESSN